MKLKKLFTFVMVASAIFLLGACGNSDEESKKKTETTPEVEQNDEKDTSKKKNETKIVDLTLEQVNEKELKVVSKAKGEGLGYAFYVIKDREIFETSGYTTDNEFSYTVTSPGKYKVRSFVRDKDGNIVKEDTETVEILD